MAFRWGVLLSALWLMTTTVLATAEPQPLWPEGAPGSKGEGVGHVPTIEAYPLADSVDPELAIVVVPGGGYGGLAVGHEGKEIAEWLNDNGISAHVLRYRHGPHYQHPVPKLDIQRAIRTVRHGLGGGAGKVGVIGFSAGGHLSATAATQFDHGDATAADPIEQMSSRPDFVVLGYPVITMTDPHTHQGSRNNLLGKDATPDAILAQSAERNVTEETPPTFLFSSSDDTVVPVQNSLLFYQALVEAGVPTEMHLFETGPHGFGLGKDDPALGAWPALCLQWIKGL